MTIQEKCIYIINELELSTKQAAYAIGVSITAIVNKKKMINRNEFSEKDFEKLKTYFIKDFELKLEKLRQL